VLRPSPLLRPAALNIDPSVLHRAAAQAAGAQQYPAGALYVVATPIGNLADLTLRAIHVLALVDALACEDTRVSAGLLRHLGVDKPLIALHQHNEAHAAALVLQRLGQGQRVAYLSDAGTPAVSDPGAVLVAQVAAAGHRVMPIPGASSVLAALSVAGDTRSHGFAFIGFLPARGADRAAALRALGTAGVAQLLFEAPHRIDTLAHELAAALPQRRLTLCRELTKQFETVATLFAAELPAWLAADANRLRGEFVLVLHAPQAQPDATASDVPDAALHMLRVLQRDLPLKQAVALAAELSGAPRNALYQAALQHRDAAAPDDAAP
jgi:16S rRNA (cytidine1402-2'-O)-methyltransferase